MRFQYYFPAAFFASYLLITNGVPLVAVAAGCAVAGCLAWMMRSAA